MLDRVLVPESDRGRSEWFTVRPFEAPAQVKHVCPPGISYLPALRQAWDIVEGVYIMPPFLRFELVARVLEGII